MIEHYKLNFKVGNRCYCNIRGSEEMHSVQCEKSLAVSWLF